MEFRGGAGLYDATWKTEECVLWDGMLKHGYGYVRKNGKRYQAHRLAWIEQVGPIPGNKKVLHKCDVKCCVNLTHLFLGSQADNIRDMASKKRDVNSKKTHCKWGHSFY